MPSISDTARERLKKLKETGGMPPKKPQGSTLGQDAKNIKIRQTYENIPEAGLKKNKR